MRTYLILFIVAATAFFCGGKFNRQRHETNLQERHSLADLSFSYAKLGKTRTELSNTVVRIYCENHPSCQVRNQSTKLAPPAGQSMQPVQLKIGIRVSDKSQLKWTLNQISAALIERSQYSGAFNAAGEMEAWWFDEKSASDFGFPTEGTK